MDADHIDRARQSNFFELTAIKECLVIYQGQPLGERDFAKNRAIRKGKSADCSDSLGDFNRLDKLMRVKSLVVDRSYGKAVVMRCNNDMLILAVFCADKYGVVADDLVFKTLRAALIVVFGTLNIGERRTLVPFFLFVIEFHSSVLPEKLTALSAVQSLKVYIPMYLRFAGRLMLSSEVQPANV